MKNTSLHQFWVFGAMHWYLVQLPNSSKILGKNGIVYSIRHLKSSLDKIGLKVTARAGEGLWELADKLEKETEKETELANAVVTSEVRHLAKQLESTLVAEARGVTLYSVTEKRIDVDKLVKKPQALLSEDVCYSLPFISNKDWFEGCMSIAFNLPTGAAFYLLRCVEGTLRNYYLSIVKNGRLPKKKRMWGLMIDKLRRRRSNRPPKELLDSLDTIRDNYRNPTNHPEMAYDIEEVQDLFGLCVDCINKMVKSEHWAIPDDSIHMKVEKRMME